MSITPSTVPSIALHGGVTVPQLGFGVFQIPPEGAERATREALEVGYRHVDTAEMYRNEAEVGRAVRASGLGRDEVFVTSKLNNGFHAPEQVARAFEGTLAALDLGYVDLFLVHWPMPTIDVDYVDTWRAMVDLLDGGRVRAVGVSNFQRAHLQRLLDETGVVPAVNQVEVHPYLAQEPLRAFGREHGIVTEAWSPIARGRVLDDPVVTGVAAAVGRTPAQVVLRWHLQRGDVVFPKTVHRDRMEENAALFDFELDGGQMGAIDALDRHERTGPDPDTFSHVPA
ncbi:MAG: aldo/keto reductase [Acidimicrobiales bacterium]